MQVKKTVVMSHIFFTIGVTTGCGHRGYSGTVLLLLWVLHTKIISIINNMPPKSYLLYSETAATVIRKHPCLETEKIVTDAVEQGGYMCARMGFV